MHLGKATKKMTSSIVVQESDLNGHGGVFCPSPLAHMSIWDAHPKVFLDVAKLGHATCPYCSTVYTLAQEVQGRVEENH
jgi:uncharacterized Zn-finger protein